MILRKVPKGFTRITVDVSSTDVTKVMFKEKFQDFWIHNKSESGLVYASVGEITPTPKADGVMEVQPNIAKLTLTRDNETVDTLFLIATEATEVEVVAVDSSEIGYGVAMGSPGTTLDATQRGLLIDIINGEAEGE